MADTQPVRRKPRGFETAADIARSLVPLIILIVALAYFCTPTNHDPVKVVDPTQDVEYFAESVDYPVYAPRGLGSEWRPTSTKLLLDESARTAPGTPGGVLGVSIGYVTPSDEFCRYTQSSQPMSLLRSTLLPGAEDDGTTTIAGRVWTLVTTDDGRGMYAEVEGSTLILAGTASQAALEQFATSLAVVPAG